METIESFLSGEMSVRDFVAALQCDDQLRKQVNGLMPSDAINEPQHDIWKRFSYETASLCGFEIVAILKKLCVFDNSLGDNLNVFATISFFYIFNYPDFPCTDQYRDAYGLFLDAVGERFDGPEVQEVTEKIVYECLDIRPKTKRVKTAKERVYETFHMEDRKLYPRWIQGSEWPMGKNSPMQFAKQTRRGESVLFYFRDVDTGEERIITQYY